MSAQPPRLILRPGKSDEKVFALTPGSYTIGRTQQNDVFVLHRSLSRQHARLTVAADGQVTLEDLGSKNGTFVDGVRIERSGLGRRHYLKCGDVVFSYVHEAGRAAAPSSGTKPELTVDPSADPMRQPLETMLGSRTSIEARSRAEDKLQILLKVSETLASPGDLDDVLVRILGLAFQILEVDRASVLLCDDEGIPHPMVARRRDGAEVGPAPFSRRIVDYVLEREVAALFGNVRDDARIAPVGSIVNQSIYASMCAPLMSRDRRLLGALYVDSVTPRRARFTQDDLEFLSAFGNQAAIAIDNATLRRRLADEALTRSTLLRFFPPTAIEAIMQAGGELKVTETPASVLFCDISGFTELCAAMKPRQVIDLLNEYFPAVVAPVFAHDGTLEKYIGDALLAAWGAPLRHDDDADRAVAAAVDMQRAVAGLNASWSSVGRSTRLAVHIGVASGEVAAGNIGSPQYVQYATVGKVTNLASRICGVAQPHEVVIDERTRRGMQRSDMHLEVLPPTRVKGHAEPLTLHRVRWRH